MSRIALDAMGGDNAPEALVAGAVSAAGSGVDVVLVGDEAVLSVHLAEHGVKVPIAHAPDIIEMGEEPSRTLRSKPNSSVAVAARLVRTGEVDGFVSAGSTGAAMASAAVLIGRVPGVARPSIASIWPTRPTATIVLDSGANTDVKADHLLQFARMGTVAAEVFLGIERPRVGLLSNGEEEGKGRKLERAAYVLLKEADLEFVGNVEGRDVGRNRADVIVTDGFTGNVFLKAVEGAARMVVQMAVDGLERLGPETAAAAMPALDEVRDLLDPETYGGGHLLGVSGVVVIAHGSSSARSIANALRLASDGAAENLVGRLRERVAGR